MISQISLTLLDLLESSPAEYFLKNGAGRVRILCITACSTGIVTFHFILAITALLSASKALVKKIVTMMVTTRAQKSP